MKLFMDKVKANKLKDKWETNEDNKHGKDKKKGDSNKKTPKKTGEFTI